MTEEFMREVVEKFKEEYDFLYENYDNVAGYNDALTAGELFIKDNPEFMTTFTDVYGDFVSSDREVVALAFALVDLGIAMM